MTRRGICADVKVHLRAAEEAYADNDFEEAEHQLQLARCACRGVEYRMARQARLAKEEPA